MQEPLADGMLTEDPGKGNVMPCGIRMVNDPANEPKPEGWTRFVCFSDTHGLHGKIPREHCPAADVLLHAGDFTNTGEHNQIESLSQWLKDYPAEHKVVIAGNHDITFDAEYYKTIGAKRFHTRVLYDTSKTKSLLTGCIYLEDSEVDVCGYRIYGSPWQPEFCQWAFNLYGTDAAAKKWAPIPSAVDILMTHGPPHGFGDRCQDGKFAGCTELTKAIKERPVAVHVSGHIHEGYGFLSDDETVYINASTCTFSYAPTNPPIVFDAPPPDELRSATTRAFEAARAKSDK